MSKILRSVISIVIGALVGWGLKYFCMPAFTINSGGMWLFVICVFAVMAGVSWLLAGILEDTPIDAIIFTTIPCIMLVVMLVGDIVSWPMFRASDYQQRITIEQGNFEEEIPEDTQQIAVVDLETARVLGSRALGELKNSTWYEIDGEYNLITYQGRQYRISPLKYGGYSKSKKAGSIPGYILVDAVNQKAKYVELDENKSIIYSPSAYWSKDLQRHLRKEYPNSMFGNSYFEVDDDGNPYWITAIRESTIGWFNGRVEKEFIITDAHTGECNVYTVEELPEWVDHAFSLSYLMSATSDSFEYVHGWKNSWWGKTNVKKLSRSYSSEGYAGYTSTITKDGIMFFTGVTPVNKTESNVGFVLMSTRTGTVKYYECPCAEESSAQEAAKSVVQQYGYEATYPSIINVSGVKTYIMTLKGNDGLNKMYALCQANEYSNVVVAETLADAIGKYRASLNGQYLDPDKIASKTGSIAEITEVLIEGYTYYYFKLDDGEEIYMSSIENSNKQAFMKKGDSVKVEYTGSTEADVYIVTKIILK